MSSPDDWFIYNASTMISSSRSGPQLPFLSLQSLEVAIIVPPSTRNLSNLSTVTVGLRTTLDDNDNEVEEYDSESDASSKMQRENMCLSISESPYTRFLCLQSIVGWSAAWYTGGSQQIWV